MIKTFFKVKDAFQDTVLCMTPEKSFLGQECFIESMDGNKIRGEVVAINEEHTTIKLLQSGQIKNNALIEFGYKKFSFPMNEQLIIGKVINCYGESIYGDEYLNKSTEYIDLAVTDIGIRLSERSPITEIYPTKVKVIDGLFTVGVGQRMGLFAPAGAGKTTTLSIIANNIDADVFIFAMIGERAREVIEFIEGDIAQDVIKKSITIVSTSDSNPLEKLRTGLVAVEIGRYFVSQGKKVVLFFDSLTRFARAKAMIDETPIQSSSIPIGVSLALSKLVESCGNYRTGSLTGFFSILIEQEIDDDPIAHEVKSLIDGHLVFSTEVASKGRYPAIEVLKSKSRLQDKIQTKENISNSNKIKDALAMYQDVEILIRIGEYKTGNDINVDKAIESYPSILNFLKQGYDGVPYEKTINIMEEVCNNL